jgi:hypothetical protein
MPGYIAKLYSQMLADENLSPVLQRRAFEVLKLAGDNKSLAILAAHPALADDLDEKLGKMKPAVIREAYVQRPNRTRDELEACFKGETRVGVLEVFAKRGDLTKAQYLHMLKVAPSIRVAEPIIANTTVPEDVRREAARVWVSVADTDRNDVRYGLSTLFDAHPQLHTILAEHATEDQDLFLRYVAGSVLSPTGQQRIARKMIIARLVPAPPQGQHRWGGPRYEWHRTIESVLEVALRFAVQPANDAALREELRVALTTYNDHLVTEGETDLAGKAVKVIKTLDSDTTVLFDSRELAATTDDVAMQTEIAKHAVQEGDDELLNALLCNTRISIGVFRELLRHIKYGGELRLAKVHADRSDVLVELMGIRPWQSETIFEAAADKATTLKLFLAGSVADNPKGLPSWVLTSEHLTLEMLRDLPFRTLAQVDVPLPVLVKLQETFVESLGDDADVWRAFEAVADSSEATVQDVLNVVAEIAPPKG